MGPAELAESAVMYGRIEQKPQFPDTEHVQVRQLNKSKR